MNVLKSSGITLILFLKKKKELVELPGRTETKLGNYSFRLGERASLAFEEPDLPLF